MIESIRLRLAHAQDFLPETARLYATVLRRRHYWTRVGVIHVHVPKAGGVSLATALYGRPLGHLPALAIRRVYPDLFRRLPVFAVVRNPWDRLVSAYRFAIAGGAGVQGVRRPALYQGPAFRSFHAFVEEWLALRSIERLDPIFRPQHTFVCDERQHVIVDLVGRLEALDDVRGKLEAALGRPIEVPHLNASKSAVDYRLYYDSRALIDVVGTLYRTDVELFGYDF